ncbi:peroxiredoxin [Granulibacter bethesdensis]|uniref:Alkyl hydroperoxide reductase C n=1 Tax=Granulibacter bethesdensis (strain ATCC BAA-1260 / CGDNIH1) TaxID=391165 RepID=Q0BTT9_GRABC|nr:Peroxiredoxin [Granulibacter bethesdensis CGDNIH1]APH51572.1 Peroxiredoxin [Granulibacter bethesdensis]APH64265.1 Peroxiredoxin [Granulibacter bethesdensis]
MKDSSGRMTPPVSPSTPIEEKPTHSACPPRLGDIVPGFCARTTHGQVSLADYRGRWLIFFSHPADFTPVCTSEFMAIARAADRFADRQCDLLGLSVDSLHAHLAWIRAIKAQFGITIPFPIVEDPSMVIGRAYGMIDPSAPDSSAVRGTFFIDPHGVLRAAIYYPMQVGRSVEEMLRLLIALQETSRTGTLTPEGWQPGEDTLLPAPVTQAEMAEITDRWLCRFQSSVP